MPLLHEQKSQKVAPTIDTGDRIGDHEVAERRPPRAMPRDAILTSAVKAATPSTAHIEMTGNTYADQGLACDAEGAGPTCFLDAATRQRTVNLFHARVLAAHVAYTNALTQLRVDELLKKEPDKSEWVLALLLDVIGALTSNVALKVFKLAVEGKHAVEGVAASAADISQGLQGQSEGTLRKGIEIAVLLGKKGLSNAAKAEAGSEKIVNIAYLDLLSDQSGLIFQNIREGVIAGIDDSRLLVMFDSFNAANHTVGAYKAALSQKLQRFAASGLRKLGVTRNEKPRHIGRKGIDTAAQHETHAFWVRMPTGVRLGLYKRAHEAPHDKVNVLDGRFNRDKTPFEKLADEMQRGTNDEGFVFVRFVENEFVDAATHMHAAKWGYAPRERLAGPYELAQMGTKEEP